MTNLSVEPLANGPGCSYYLVSEAVAGGPLAVVEGESLAEAQALLDAMSCLLGVAPGVSLHLAPVDVLPQQVPVFTVVYLRALRDRAARESQMPGTTRH